MEPDKKNELANNFQKLNERNSGPIEKIKRMRMSEGK